MKTRTALVSNSSSSSFILIGVPINVCDLNKSHITPYSKTITLSTMIMGKYLGEGRDIFQLTEEGQLNFVKDHSELFPNAFIKCTYIYDSSDVISLKTILDSVKEDLPNLVLIGGTADQNNSSNTECLLNNYEEEIAEKVKEEAKEKYRKKYNPK